MSLLIMVLSNSLKTTLVYTWYFTDINSFIEQLCENKEKPDLQCNGKCHLKKVSESQSNEKRTPASIIDLKEILFFTNAIEENNILNLVDLVNTKKQPFIYSNLYKSLEVSLRDHPPRI